MARSADVEELVRLLQVDEHRRRQWLDRRRPAPHERANWWPYLLLFIDKHLGDQSDRRALWAELKLWYWPTPTATPGADFDADGCGCRPGCSCCPGDTK